MEIGLLWYDTGDITGAVVRAATRYRERFGVVPNTCFVNSALLSEERNVGVVTVKPLKGILKDHYWIGVERKAQHG